MRLGDTPDTIVGVMPEGFAFPILHGCWVPLGLTEVDANPGGSPPLNVFGRIADGYSFSQVGAELTAIGQRMLILFQTVAALMFAVGLLAAAGPARRGPAIEPTETLRTE